MSKGEFDFDYEALGDDWAGFYFGDMPLGTTRDVGSNWDEVYDGEEVLFRG